jgi:hypothetical protein
MEDVATYHFPDLFAAQYLETKGLNMGGCGIVSMWEAADETNSNSDSIPTPNVTTGEIGTRSVADISLYLPFRNVALFSQCSPVMSRVFLHLTYFSFHSC